MQSISDQIALSGIVLPLAILAIENDEDRQFVTDLYIQYKPLMYKVAYSFFRHDLPALEDAVSSAVERICDNCEKIKAVACNKRASYLVIIVRNVCLNILQVKRREWIYQDDLADHDTVGAIPDQEDVQSVVFDSLYVSDLLNAFPKLNEREKELIRMRHIDQMDYETMAKITHMREGAVRTALSRAKKKLERYARDCDWMKEHE